MQSKPNEWIEDIYKYKRGFHPEFGGLMVEINEIHGKLFVSFRQKSKYLPFTPRIQAAQALQQLLPTLHRKGWSLEKHLHDSTGEMLVWIATFKRTGRNKSNKWRWATLGILGGFGMFVGLMVDWVVGSQWLFVGAGAFLGIVTASLVWISEGE